MEEIEERRKRYTEREILRANLEFMKAKKQNRERKSGRLTFRHDFADRAAAVANVFAPPLAAFFSHLSLLGAKENK